MVRRFAFLFGTLALCACAQLPGTFANNLGLPGTHEVVYSVSCERCEVTYTAGLHHASENIEGSWSIVVQADARVTPAVTLTVTPARAGIFVRRAEIFVDGRRVARERRDHAEASGDQVRLAATIRR